MRISIESPATFGSPNITVPIGKIRGLVSNRSETISEVLSGLLGGPIGAAVARLVSDRISSLSGPMPGNMDVKLMIETDTGGIPIAFNINLRIEGDK